MIKKVLIANRGEIALRIIRTARSLGYTIVSVYSEQDKDAAHVKESDEAIYLSGDILSETYLNIDAIIKAAKDTGADAIHPGYGFLSENPLFAKACETAGIIFVGPSSESISAMGNKIAAREIARKHGVPIAPGLTGSPEELLERYKEVGFPLLIKAAAGGGGKGMRIVRSEDEMASALRSTSSEAANYFGDGTVYIERFFDGPRHIEVQVLGDKFGKMIHLFERECSMQRRHQKIIEEAPSPTLTSEVREKMCSAAITLASSIGYYCAGTIEFLVDNDLNFYFLEMNTRIQVEHPVTEFITGVDIVKEQFMIAQDNPLSLEQNELTINGHSIEVRVYAEDPLNNFMPSPGQILKYNSPSTKSTTGSSSLRIDDSKFHDHSVVFSNFDPMISKVIAHGKDRTEAIAHLTDFLPDYSVFGIKTNLSFLQVLLKHPDFISNKIHTRYIDNNLPQLISFFNESKSKIDPLIPLTGALVYSLKKNQSKDTLPSDIWSQIGYWRLYRTVSASLDDKFYTVIIEKHDGDSIIYKYPSQSDPKSFIKGAISKKGDHNFLLSLNDVLSELYIIDSDREVLVKYLGHDFVFKRTDIAPDDSQTMKPVRIENANNGDMISPMPGRVLSVKVTQGLKVNKGDLLIVIEAMKMENNILAPYDGTVDKILVKEGASVDTSSHLVHLSRLPA